MWCLISCFTLDWKSPPFLSPWQQSYTQGNKRNHQDHIFVGKFPNKHDHFSTSHFFSVASWEMFSASDHQAEPQPGTRDMEEILAKDSVSTKVLEKQRLAEADLRMWKGSRLGWWQKATSLKTEAQENQEAPVEPVPEKHHAQQKSEEGKERATLKPIGKTVAQILHSLWAVTDGHHQNLQHSSQPVGCDHHKVGYQTSGIPDLH